MDEKEKSISEEYEFSVILTDNATTEQDVILKAARTLEPLAKICVSLNLNNCGLEDADDKSDLMLLPAVLDEVISVKEISDIGKWKELEKASFEEGLEKIKTRELKKLQDEFQAKKDKMEEQLNKSVSKCKKLQDDLQNKVDMLKIEKYLISKRNSSKIYEDIFKENWEKFQEENTKELIELLSKIQRDNEHLKEILNEQRKELNIIEKSTLTKTETGNLLQELRVLEEQFEEAQCAKNYFEEHLRRTGEEINEIEREDATNIQNQTQQDKDRLSPVSLHKFTRSHLENEDSQEDVYVPDSVRSGTSGHFYFS